MKAVEQNHQIKNVSDDEQNLRMKPARAQKNEYCFFEFAPVDSYLKKREQVLVSLQTNFLYWLCQQEVVVVEEEQDLQEQLVQEPVDV